MESRGKWAVLAILLVGLTLGVFGWWWNLQRSRRCAEFWGPQAALQIRQAKRVIASELAVGNSPLVDEAAGEPATIAVFKRVKDVSTFPGLIHARNSLLDDASFQWDQAPPESPKWTHQLQFENPENEREPVRILFDLESGSVWYLGTDKKGVLVESMRRAWKQTFLERYFPEPEPASAEN